MSTYPNDTRIHFDNEDDPEDPPILTLEVNRGQSLFDGSPDAFAMLTIRVSGESADATLSRDEAMQLSVWLQGRLGE